MTLLLTLGSLLLGFVLGFLAACALIRNHDERRGTFDVGPY